MADGDDDFYAILGVDRACSDKEIKQKYKKLALTCHPDRGGDADVFARINRAYEVLSDAQSRQRYDNTGKTKDASGLEEFFSFMGRDTGMTVMEERRERERREAEAEAERQRQEDFQGLRMTGFDMHGLGQAKPNGSYPVQAQPSPGKSFSSGARVTSQGIEAKPKAAERVERQPAYGGAFSVGARVMVHGIKARPEMNGLCGTLIFQREDRWQVYLDDDCGEKLLKEKNLKVLDGSGRSPAPAATPSEAAPRRRRPLASKKNPIVGDRSDSASSLDLPTREFEVVHDRVIVRESPSLLANILGQRTRGARVVAIEETFDGWVKLDGMTGWILKDMRGEHNLGELLRPLPGQPVKLAAPVLADEPGPQNFEVVFSPQVIVRLAPSKKALGKALRKVGSIVSVESQTYNGWVRLMDDAGWMLSADQEFGQLLRCCYMANTGEQVEEPRSRQEQVPPAAPTEVPVKPPPSVKASTPAKAATPEQESGSREHDVLLSALAEATKSGDAASVKRARDAAKKGGVSTKEIARVYALHSRNAEQDAPLPETTKQPPPAAQPETIKQPPPTALPETNKQQPPAADAVTPKRPQSPCQEPARSFHGSWIGQQSGEFMATIGDNVIQWDDGPPKELKYTSSTTVSTEMFDQVFTAELAADGSLIWSDGDVWIRQRE